MLLQKMLSRLISWADRRRRGGVEVEVEGGAGLEGCFEERQKQNIIFQGLFSQRPLYKILRCCYGTCITLLYGRQREGLHLRSVH